SSISCPSGSPACPQGSRKSRARVSDTLLVNAIASVIGGQLGLADGVAASNWGLTVAVAAVAALAALSCSSAPAIPPSVMPAMVAETFVSFIVDRTTPDPRGSVRNAAPSTQGVTYGAH